MAHGGVLWWANFEAATGPAQVIRWAVIRWAVNSGYNHQPTSLITTIITSAVAG